MAVTETQLNLRLGGITGQISKGSVKNCYNTSNIYGKGLKECTIGGIVGYVYTGDYEISNCYNRGLLEGENKERKWISVKYGGNYGFFK